MLKQFPLKLLITCLLFMGIQCTHQTTQSDQSKESTTLLPANKKDAGPKMTGLSFVAPPNPFEKNPMPAVQAVGADWIAVIPFAYTLKGEASVHFNSNRQWWGERPEGVRETIQLAKEAGIKILMKPQVYFPGSWPGDLDFDNDADWSAWEKDYETYLMTFVEIAKEMEVEMICIGTEFKQSETKREQFWRDLIKKIRASYTGKLVYAANWDCYDKVPFWDDLDYIGIDAYFPLVDSKTPDIAALKKAWQKPLQQIRRLHKKVQRPVLFTEFGYLAVDGCAYNTWELESKVRRLPQNQQAQANALDALFEVFWQEPYWQGCFLWKWFPNMKGHEGYIAVDYTPQGKLGEEVIKKWYIEE